MWGEEKLKETKNCKAERCSELHNNDKGKEHLEGTEMKNLLCCCLLRKKKYASCKQTSRRQRKM